MDKSAGSNYGKVIVQQSHATLVEETPRMVQKRVENWGMSGRKLKRNVN